MKILKITTLTISALLTGHMAHAAPVHPDALESATPGGDYSDTVGTGPNITSSQPILVGQTSLLGGLRLNCVATDCSDSSGLRDPSDAFFLTIGADRELTSLVLDIASGNSPALDLSSITFGVQVDNPAAASSSTFSFTGAMSGLDLIPGITGSQQFGPGTYGFYIGANGSSADFTGRIDWTLTATIIDTSVSTVPVPASLPLLLAGVFGLGFANRREQRRKTPA